MGQTAIPHVSGERIRPREVWRLSRVPVWTGDRARTKVNGIHSWFTSHPVECDENPALQREWLRITGMVTGAYGRSALVL